MAVWSLEQVDRRVSSIPVSDHFFHCPTGHGSCRVKGRNICMRRSAAWEKFGPGGSGSVSN